MKKEKKTSLIPSVFASEFEDFIIMCKKCNSINIEIEYDESEEESEAYYCLTCQNCEHEESCWL